MNREFLINVIFLVAINLLIKPFYLFGIDRTVQNTVESGAYGLYFALFNFTFLLQIINDFGLQHFNNRNIAQHRQLLGKYFPNMLILKGLLAALFFATVLVVGYISGYAVDYFPLLALLAINQSLLSLILFLRSNISGLGLYRTDSFLSAFDRLLMIVICGGLLIVPNWRAQFRIEWFILSQTASLALTALVAFGVVYGRLPAFRLRWRPRFWWLILRQSAPYASVIFLMTIYTRIDGVMIERLLPDGLVQADLYASAYRLLDASNMIGFLFAGLLFPMFARMIKRREPVGPLVRLSLQLLIAGAGSLAVATIAFRTEIMVALYTNGSAYSGRILTWLMLSFIAISGSYIYGTLLGAKGAMRAMNKLALGGVFLNVLLNLLLLPYYKALGAAVATCITQFLLFFAQAVVAFRLLDLDKAPGMIARIGLFFFLLVLLNYFLYDIVNGFWWLRYFIALASGIALAATLKLIDFNHVFSLLKEKGIVAN